jgi:ABC-type molybdenum transport system ATPase subunit/photorepair protein PhrA
MSNKTTPLLDRLTLQIATGEHVCILGPNGCGKSTLIKTITRECYPVQRRQSNVHSRAQHGPKEELLTSEQLSALFGAHVRVLREEGYFHVHA